MKIFGALKKLFCIVDTEAAAKLNDEAAKLNDKNLVRDTGLSIKDYNAQIKNLQNELAKFMAETSLIKLDETAAIKDVEKYTDLTQKAAKDENKEGVIKLLTKAGEAKTHLQGVRDQLSENTKLIEEIRGQISAKQDLIQKAEIKHARLALKLKGAEMRTSFVTATSKLEEGNNPFSQLDKLEEKVNLQTGFANALEELESPDDIALLEEQYSSDASDIAAEADRLMAEAKGN